MSRQVLAKSILNQESFKKQMRIWTINMECSLFEFDDIFHNLQGASVRSMIANVLEKRYSLCCR